MDSGLNKKHRRDPACNNCQAAKAKCERLHTESCLRCQSRNIECKYVTIISVIGNGVLGIRAIQDEVEAWANKYLTDETAREFEIYEPLDSCLPQPSPLASVPLKLSDCIRTLPEKDKLDQIISLFFESGEPAWLTMIHKQSFWREYEKFYVDPSTVSFAFISMVFGIISHVSFYCHKSRTSVPGYPYVASKVFRENLFQCSHWLDSSEPTTPGEYKVEANICHFAARYHRHPNAQGKALVAFAYIVRLAQLSGYEKIPRNITPFEAEMRRRTWLLIREIDQQLSYLFNVTPMIPWDSIVDRPRNLRNGDFNEKSVELHHRGITEPTAVGHYLLKGIIGDVFGEILHVDRAIEYKDILALDKKLNSQYLRIPPEMRFTWIDSTVEALATHKKSLLEASWKTSREFAHQKGRLWLHMTFIIQWRKRPELGYSRQVCLDAARKIIILYRKAREFPDPWLLNSLSTRDFYLAAVVVCIEISFLQRPEASPVEKATVKELLQILEDSREIWEMYDTGSMEYKAYRFLCQTLMTKGMTVESRREAKNNGLEYLNNMGLQNCGWPLWDLTEQQMDWED